MSSRKTKSKESLEEVMESVAREVSTVPKPIKKEREDKPEMVADTSSTAQRPKVDANNNARLAEEIAVETPSPLSSPFSPPTPRSYPFSPLFPSASQSFSSYSTPSQPSSPFSPPTPRSYSFSPPTSPTP